MVPRNNASVMSFLFRGEIVQYCLLTNRGAINIFRSRMEANLANKGSSSFKGSGHVEALRPDRDINGI